MLLSLISEFININKNVLSYTKHDDTYHSAREAFNEVIDTDIKRMDNRIYFRNDDWHIITPSDPKDYDKDDVIGVIKKQTTDE